MLIRIHSTTYVSVRSFGLHGYLAEAKRKYHFHEKSSVLIICFPVYVRDASVVITAGTCEVKTLIFVAISETLLIIVENIFPLSRSNP